jgi:signal transduction histidine kinase
VKRLRLWPGSLFGRVALILFLGLAAAHTLSFWLVTAERGLAMRGMMVSYLARDVASSVAILERVPAAERAGWLPRLERRSYRFRLDVPVGGAPSNAALAEPVTRAIAAALAPPREVSAVDVGKSEAGAAGTALRLQLRLADGTPLSVDLAEPRLDISPWVLAVLAAQLALLGGLSWLAVRLATRPLQQLAEAADALGPAQAATPLPEQGPREVARAAIAFNAMQERIRTHLEERMRILAAVSHDLQTPITRLRLRAELMEDAALRSKLLADLAEMQALVEEGVSYARSAQAIREQPCAVDLRALLDSLACDYADAGQPVRLLDGPGGIIRTRPHALRRLVGNLVDNALKFAGAAEIAVAHSAHGAIGISVLDRGPGIPPGELQAVLQPFYRLETSRSRETGGTGLGLAIAQQLAQALGGQLVLAAREGGGLQARLELPAEATRPLANG